MRPFLEHVGVVRINSQLSNYSMQELDTYRPNGDKVVRSDRILNKYKWRGKGRTEEKHRRVTTQVNLDNVHGFNMFSPTYNIQKELDFVRK